MDNFFRTGMSPSSARRCLFVGIGSLYTLNPLRGKIAVDLEALNRYPYCGHSALMGNQKGNGRIQNMFSGFLVKIG